MYGADEYGNVLGVDEMKAEIYARGPIACSINSEANAFNYYQGGVIKCDSALDVSCKSPLTDHVIIIAGWGVEESTGTPYWVGRNSYGTRVSLFSELLFSCCNHWVFNSGVRVLAEDGSDWSWEPTSSTWSPTPVPLPSLHRPMWIAL